MLKKSLLLKFLSIIENKIRYPSVYWDTLCEYWVGFPTSLQKNSCAQIFYFAPNLAFFALPGVKKILTNRGVQHRHNFADTCWHKFVHSLHLLQQNWFSRKFLLPTETIDRRKKLIFKKKKSSFFLDDLKI